VVVSAVDEVRDVLERFRAGWEALDIPAVLDCFANDPNTVVIGTDANEYWRGFNALLGPFHAMGDAFGDAHYAWAQGPAITMAGDLAWADGVLDTSMTADRAQIDVRLRTTWVLRLQPEGWKIMQAHFSVAPTSPVVAY
jgi:ketosteroid isomerase-like protein